jgi:hypothetical protein
VDRDSLRNAVNSFTYKDPINLPQMAPASQLSSEPHSFSRLFTSAFYESLGGLLTVSAATPGSPTQQELLSTANDLAGILVAAIKRSPIVSNWYAQVAASMVQVAGTVNQSYPAVLKGVFVKRSILSLQAATTVETLHKSLVAATSTPQGKPAPLDLIALPAAHYGLEKSLLVEAPSQPRSFVATAAAGDASPIEPASAVVAAQAFVDDLFRGGRVDYGDTSSPERRIAHGRRLRTHELVASDRGIHLKRRLFDCGWCCLGKYAATAA